VAAVFQRTSALLRVVKVIFNRGDCSNLGSQSHGLRQFDAAGCVFQAGLGKYLQIAGFSG
jgi:hypothetical protein